jgi:5-methylcytosine-specific restriction endonuclease McrA
MADPFYRSKLWSALRTKALSRDRYVCSVCGVRCLGKRLGLPSPVVDHIRSRRSGGADTLDNLTTMCLPCHNTKTKYVDLNNKEVIDINGYPPGWGG